MCISLVKIYQNYFNLATLVFNLSWANAYFNLFLFDFVKIYNIIIATVIFKGNKKCTN